MMVETQDLVSRPDFSEIRFVLCQTSSQFNHLADQQGLIIGLELVATEVLHFLAQVRTTSAAGRPCAARAAASNRSRPNSSPLGVIGFGDPIGVKQQQITGRQVDRG